MRYVHAGDTRASDTYVLVHIVQVEDELKNMCVGEKEDDDNFDDEGIPDPCVRSTLLPERVHDTNAA